MGFQGKLSDLSLVDILQIVQMTQKSGVLELAEGRRRASIVFRAGSIVDARPPGSGLLTEWLEERGRIPLGAAARAVEAQRAVHPHVPIGQLLVQHGAITEEALRASVVERVETTIYAALGWVRGTFDFHIGAEGAGSTPVLGYEEVLPGLDLNTQELLLEALRVFDERRAAGESAPAVEAAPRPTVLLVGPQAFRERTRIATTGLGAELVEVDDAAAAAKLAREEDRQPLVAIVSCAPGQGRVRECVRRLLVRGRRSAVITVGPDMAVTGEALLGGAVAHVTVLEADPGPCLAYLQVLAVEQLAALAKDRPARRLPGRGVVESFSGEIGRVHRQLDVLAREIHTSSVTGRLLEFVAERLDRGILFLVRGDQLRGVGGFGEGKDGEPIGPHAVELKLPLEAHSPLRRAIEERRSLLCELGRSDGERKLYERIGAPEPPDCLLLPLCSSEAVLAVVYADNGFTGRPIRDYLMLEVLAKQAGLALENSLLRRRLGAAASGA